MPIRLLVMLAVMATSAAVIAAPAMAEFESTTGKSQGPITTFPGTSTFESVEGGPAVSCKSTNAEGKVVAEGGWVVQVKDFTQQGKDAFQEPTTKGPHEQFKIEKWGVCTGPTGVAAEVSCDTQNETAGTNPRGGFSFRSVLKVVAKVCTFIVGLGENTCTLIVPSDGNKELQGATVENVAGGVSIADTVKGITSMVQESKTLCKTLGIKGGQKTGKFFTKNSFIATGQKLG